VLEPHRLGAYFRNPGGTLLNAGSAPVWPRYLHFVTGGLAMRGLFVALYGRFKGRRDWELGARDRTRDECVYLKPFLAPETLTVAPEYSPLLLFTVTLLVGVATIVWMLRKTAMLYRNRV
jgi:hypothetical protein